MCSFIQTVKGGLFGSAEQSLDAINVDSLWNPRYCNHSNWIITLSTTLISTGAVRDEILQMLRPMCKIRVRTLYKANYIVL